MHQDQQARTLDPAAVTSVPAQGSDLILVVDPEQRPNPQLVIAAARSGALGVLDLPGPRAARHLIQTTRHVATPFALRLPYRLLGSVLEATGPLPDQVCTVILSGRPGDNPSALAGLGNRQVLIEATSRSEGIAARRAGATGLVAKGCEAGGRTGDTGAFVLSQQIARLGVPFWVQGGITEHTAAAAITCGATGIMLDTRPGPPASGTSGPSHQTVRDAVECIRRSIEHRIRSAQRHRPLAPGQGVAERIGMRYPVVQGPMTRLSDRATFARAVADAGGLPVLALGTMHGRDARDLLAATAELLEDRPWGAGTPVSLPPKTRGEQLDTILNARPPVAMVAGLRPNQARLLDDAGIRAFLHAPDPDLLDQFLAAGSRRFVFEGREGGGHVGPSSSFSLWSAQIERLLQGEPLEDMEVLFAGGIHDARSAAMVAAVGAPLAERGAAIGVLMGTAYLFTDEVVATGAASPTFQEMARSCQATALLETGPGQATRCIDSEYLQTFSARRAQLANSGMSPEAIAAELEAFNCGRLQVATKGLLRQGEQLVSLDEGTQRREGLYMIGQVATLRQDNISIADLHEQVTTGATDHLDQIPVPETGPFRPRQSPATDRSPEVAMVPPGNDPFPAEPGADAVIRQYLASMRHLAEAQHEVLLRYLGDRAGEVAQTSPNPQSATVEAPIAEGASPDAVVKAHPVSNESEPQRATPEPTAKPSRPERFLLETVTLPALPNAANLDRRTVAVVSDPWDGLHDLTDRLQQMGASVHLVPVHRGTSEHNLPVEVADTLAEVDAVLHLGGADPVIPADAGEVFAMLYPALAGKCHTVVTVTRTGHERSPDAATGVPGLVRRLAVELPDRVFRAVQLGEDLPDPRSVPDILAAELAAAIDVPDGPGAPVTVTYGAGARGTRKLGKGQAIDRATPALPLNAGSVVVVIGGARGIAAQCVLALAQATGCRLELLGNIPEPYGTDEAHGANPGDGNDQHRVADEIRTTLDRAAQQGSSVAYHEVDVSDPGALLGTLDEIRSRHGRIDAVIHGPDPDDSHNGPGPDFGQVFPTKVYAARTLLSYLQDDVRLVVLFGSIGAVLGDRGRLDHAAADDALGDLANRFDGLGGRRVVCIHWGPWAGPGNSDPDTVPAQPERNNAGRGIEAIQPEEGAAAFLAELATLPGEPAEVIIMGAETEGAPPPAPSGAAPVPAPDTQVSLTAPGGHGG